MTRRLAFTIYHGLAASLVLHSALGLPVVLHGLAPEPEPPATLIVELKGVVAAIQTEQKDLGDTQEEMTPHETPPAPPAQAAVPPQPPPPEEPPPEKEAPEKEAPEVVAKEQIAVPAPPEPESEPMPAQPQTAGVEEQQRAQTIRRDRETELDRLRAYVKLLTKKVQANLVYPDAGRRAGLQGTATVSFTILGDGRIRPETLAIVKSSGQRALDTSALQTIRASVPFDPPPKEISVSIDVAFGRKS